MSSIVLEANPSGAVPTVGLSDADAADRIAEAEQLAADALRMANEAKRAAERLAEVKATLARFSKKIESYDVKKVIVVEKKPTVDIAAAPTEAKSTEKNVALVAEPTVVSRHSPSKSLIIREIEDKDIIESVLDSIGLDKACGIDDLVAEPTVGLTPRPSKGRIIKEIEDKDIIESVLDSIGLDKACGIDDLVVEPTTVPTPNSSEGVIIREIEDKDIIESILDSLGFDKACGIEDEAVMQALASSQGVAVYQRPTPKKVTIKTVAKHDSRSTKSTSASPVSTVYDFDPTALPTEDDIQKDVVELFFDYTVGRACGVDDVTLGLALPTTGKIAEFVNPTKIADVKLSKSIEEQVPTEQRALVKFPSKVYQTTPTNYDEFTDPFGVDHDTFVTCGALADICEPDFRAFEEATFTAVIKEDRLVAAPPTKQNEESHALVEGEQAEKEEVADVKPEKVEIVEVVEKEEASEDPVVEEAVVEDAVVEEAVVEEKTSQCDPEGEKTSDDELYAAANEETGEVKEEANAVEAAKDSEGEAAPVADVKEEKKASNEDEEITVVNELQRRELQRIMREQEDLLRQLNNHVWCV